MYNNPRSSAPQLRRASQKAGNVHNFNGRKRSMRRVKKAIKKDTDRSPYCSVMCISEHLVMCTDIRTSCISTAKDTIQRYPLPRDYLEIAGKPQDSSNNPKTLQTAQTRPNEQGASNHHKVPRISSDDCMSAPLFGILVFWYFGDLFALFLAAFDMRALTFDSPGLLQATSFNAFWRL